MDESHKLILQTNFVKFLEDLDVKEILPYTYETQIFTSSMIDQIKSERTERDRASAVIMKLQQRGPLAYDKFYYCLVAVHSDHLANLLKPDVDIDQYRRDHPELSKMTQSKVQVTQPIPESGSDDTEQYVPKDSTSGLLNIDIKTAEELKRPSDTVYSMIHSPRGLALILNNRKFTTRKLPERTGTDIDATNMKILLQKLEFRVISRSNKTAVEMKKELEAFRNNKDHFRYESAIVVILSHGSREGIYGTDGETINIEDITVMFDAANCQALIDKPKIFIVQACRGSRIDVGVDRVDGRGEEPSSAVTDAEVFVEKAKVPTAADMQFAFSTLPGYVSWRNEEKGSWFIQAIVQVFQKCAHFKELQHLFLRVNKYLSEQFHRPQMACVDRMLLRKEFYFNPGLSDTASYLHRPSVSSVQ